MYRKDPGKIVARLRRDVWVTGNLEDEREPLDCISRADYSVSGLVWFCAGESVEKAKRNTARGRFIEFFVTNPGGSYTSRELEPILDREGLPAAIDFADEFFENCRGFAWCHEKVKNSRQTRYGLIEKPFSPEYLRMIQDKERGLGLKPVDQSTWSRSWNLNSSANPVLAYPAGSDIFSQSHFALASTEERPSKSRVFLSTKGVIEY